MFFLNVNEPTPSEIREWMKLNNLNVGNASNALGISKRQFSRILSGESKAKRLHALAMQMIWLINENKRKIIDENQNKTLSKKSIKIPIR